MVLRRIFAIFALLFSPLVAAQALDVNLNNGSAQFKFSTSAGLFIQGNSDFFVSVLYNDIKNTFFDGGLMVRGEEQSVPGLSVGAGVKAVGSVIQDVATTYNGSAIAIGCELAYELPMLNRTFVVGEYFGGTKITSFVDAERFNQGSVRLEYELTPQTRVYAAYREISFGIKNVGAVVLDRGSYAGLNLAF